MHFPDNFLEQTENFVNGVNIGSVTLVGYMHKKFPHPSGNCFSMIAENGVEYKVVNFNYENMEELINNRGIKLPIRLYILGDAATSRTAVVCETRINNSWYSKEFCTVCTPNKYLSFTQRLAEELLVESGEVTFRGDGSLRIRVQAIGKSPNHETLEEYNERQAAYKKNGMYIVNDKFTGYVDNASTTLEDK